MTVMLVPSTISEPHAPLSFDFQFGISEMRGAPQQYFRARILPPRLTDQAIVSARTRAPVSEKLLRRLEALKREHTLKRQHSFEVGLLNPFAIWAKFWASFLAPSHPSPNSEKLGRRADEIRKSARRNERSDAA